MTIELDHSAAARERRDAKVRKMMEGVPMTGKDYHSKKQQAVAAVADAAKERDRIRLVIQKGVDMGRGRAALRLALLGVVDAGQAGTILENFPPDMEASEAAQKERRRLAAIFGHPSAQGRFLAASAIALQGEFIPPEAALALLVALPVEPKPERVLSLEERSAGLQEFGDDFGSGSMMSKTEKTQAAWSRAVQEANHGIGVRDAAEPTRGPSGDVSGMDMDEAFGMTEAAREALFKAGGQG